MIEAKQTVEGNEPRVRRLLSGAATYNDYAGGLDLDVWNKEEGIQARVTFTVIQSQIAPLEINYQF